MALFNNDSNMAGIYRSYITKIDEKSGKQKIYIPSIHTINPYEYEEGSEEYKKALELLPEVRWCLPEQVAEDEPIWVTFEGGNIKYPVIIGFFRDVIKNQVIYTGGSSDSTEDSSDSTGDSNNYSSGEMSSNTPNSSGWIWPTTVKIITSKYGSRDIGIGSKNHAGIDIGVGMNTPVYAAKDGVVTKAQWNDGYGKNIDIVHDNGTILSRYAHLNSFKVKVGDNVVCGQEIALSGNTGVGSGPHLHFEIRNPNQLYGYKGSYDPLGFVKP